MARKLQEQWQVDKTLNECNHHMLKYDFEFNDVTFRLHYKHQDKGHNVHEPLDVRSIRLLLLARSPVFYAMFSGELAQDDNKPIDVDDIEPDAFKEMLRFIYTDEVNLTNDNVTAILYASKKYIITNLTKKCLQFLEAQLSADSAPQILEQSLLYDERELKDKVLTTIQLDALAVLSSQNFMLMSQEALHEILQMNLEVNREIEVFEATMKWATNKCEELGRAVNGTNLRQALGEDLYLLRIPTMSVDEFNEIVLPYDVLTPAEGFEIFRILTAKSYQFDKLPFHTAPRKGFKCKLILIPGPYSQKSGRLMRSETFGLDSRLECQLSKPIWLKKILIHGCEANYSLEHCLKVTVEQCKKTLFTYNGAHPTSPMATGNSPQYAIDVPCARLATGKLQLNINLQLSLKSSGLHMHGSYFAQISPSHAKVSDDYVSLTFPPNDENILLGIEYAPFAEDM